MNKANEDRKNEQERREMKTNQTETLRKANELTLCAVQHSVEAARCEEQNLLSPCTPPPLPALMARRASLLRIRNFSAVLKFCAAGCAPKECPSAVARRRRGKINLYCFCLCVCGCMGVRVCMSLCCAGAPKSKHSERKNRSH